MAARKGRKQKRADPTYAKLKSLIGKRVRAKRAGWECPPEGQLNKYGTDILDPPAWRDDGLPEEVEGVLSMRRFKGSKFIDPYTAWSVANEPVDPDTVEPLE
jgi:hypothetical protein